MRVPAFFAAFPAAFFCAAHDVFLLSRGRKRPRKAKCLETRRIDFRRACHIAPAGIDILKIGGKFSGPRQASRLRLPGQRRCLVLPGPRANSPNGRHATAQSRQGENETEKARSQRESQPGSKAFEKEGPGGWRSTGFGPGPGSGPAARRERAKTGLASEARVRATGHARDEEHR